MGRPDRWLVMATHTIRYKGEEGKVEVVQVTQNVPEFFFHVHLPGRELLLSRLAKRPGIWNGSSVTQAEAKALGESIEEQIGYRLPVEAVNNPFLYQGDLEVRVERFRISTLLIERAKAPFTRDIYYRIVLSKNRIVTMICRDFLGEGRWTCDGDCRVKGKEFDLFKSLLVDFEKAYKQGVYAAER